MACARCNAPMPPGPFRLHCKRCAPARGRLSLAPPRPQQPDPPRTWNISQSRSNWDHVEKIPTGTKTMNGLRSVYIHTREDADATSNRWQIWLNCRCLGEATHEFPAPEQPKQPPKEHEWRHNAPPCPRCHKKEWSAGREIYLITPKRKNP